MIIAYQHAYAAAGVRVHPGRLGRTTGRAGFTLVELLVAIAIIGILASALTYASATALSSAKRVACASNLRQLHMANSMHASETGFYAPAAADLFSSNLERWHGTRARVDEPFDGTSGPLSPFLGGGRVRACPSQGVFRRGSADNAFEAACGGYGYNATGVGSQTYQLGMCEAALRQGAAPEWIADPAHTVMFCDSAFPQPYGSNPAYLIEYSFAEAYHWVFEPGVETEYRADPSIHFRHRGRANVVWCDGRVSGERLETEAEAHFTRWRVGWFGPEDNSLFDPR